MRRYEGDGMGDAMPGAGRECPRCNGTRESTRRHCPGRRAMACAEGRVPCGRGMAMAGETAGRVGSSRQNAESDGVPSGRTPGGGRPTPACARPAGRGHAASAGRLLRQEPAAGEARPSACRAADACRRAVGGRRGRCYGEPSRFRPAQLTPVPYREPCRAAGDRARHRAAAEPAAAAASAGCPGRPAFLAVAAAGSPAPSRRLTGLAPASMMAR